uniref:Uncharacterized protein n=1 Tax=Arundo donax TaxID=35708 RepID=A0A0A8ZUU1_ARUDO
MQHQHQRRGDLPKVDATTGIEGQRRQPAAPVPHDAAMDTFFLSHSAATLSIDEMISARYFFKSWLPARVAGDHSPRAILVMLGH